MDRRKSASLTKFLGTAAKKIRKGEGLNYLKKFKDPTHNFDPKSSRGFIETHEMQKGKANLSRGVRTSIGNTADSLDKIRKDVRGKGLLGGTKQLGKNVYNLGKKQVKGDLYKEVDNPIITRKNGKRYAKSR